MNVILSLLLLLSLPLISSCGSPTKTPNINTATTTVTTSEEDISSVNVSIKEFAFNPEFIKIKKGTIVTWTNDDQVIHRVKSSLFSSNLINPGQSFSFIFNEIGPIEYYCPVHPTMNGHIIIE